MLLDLLGLESEVDNVLQRLIVQAREIAWADVHGPCGVGLPVAEGKLVAEAYAALWAVAMAGDRGMTEARLLMAKDPRIVANSDIGDTEAIAAEPVPQSGDELPRKGVVHLVTKE